MMFVGVGIQKLLCIGVHLLTLNWLSNVKIQPVRCSVFSLSHLNLDLIITQCC